VRPACRREGERVGGRAGETAREGEVTNGRPHPCHLACRGPLPGRLFPTWTATEREGGRGDRRACLSVRHPSCTLARLQTWWWWVVGW